MNNAVLKSQLFGPIAYTESEGTYQTVSFQDTRTQQQTTLQIFEGLSSTQLAQIEPIIDQLPVYSDRARSYLLAELSNNNGVIDFFINYHKDELGDELAEFFNLNDVAQLTSQHLVERLLLNNIVIYLDKNKGIRVVFDYMVNPEMSDEILVVSCDLNGVITDLSHES